MVETREKRRLSVIDPAQGEGKERLLRDCLALTIANKEKFDGGSWRRFTSNMVSLLGGKMNGKGDEVTTPWMLVENELAIKLSSLARPDMTGEHFLEETRVVIMPASVVLPKNKYLQRKPHLEETIETGRAYFPEQSVARLSSVLKAPGIFGHMTAKSFVQGGALRLGKDEGIRSRPREALVTNDQLEELAFKIYSAFTLGQRRIPSS